jgi:CRISPR/Cas system-associated exonuclease Cas4 (RecB family)
MDPIRVDVSEIKTFKACRRQWMLSSRNRYHLVPTSPQPALALGTLFHEALAQLYLGASYEAVMKLVKQEMNKDDIALLAMLKGYADRVLPHDLERWTVLDVEHRFEFPHPTIPDLNLCGSIDLIVYDQVDRRIYGVEHKTCSTFRDEAFLWMDEQPRLYYEALEKYVENLNEEKGGAPNHSPARVGGIYINEVKKLLRDFQYKRVLCSYDEEDRAGFWEAWTQDVEECHIAVTIEDEAERPKPSYFGCKLCSFAPLCAAYGYRTIPKDVIFSDYAAEYKVRECDHLDEKLDFGNRLKTTAGSED